MKTAPFQSAINPTKIAKTLYDNLLDYDIISVDYLDKIKKSSLNGEKYNVLMVPYSESISEEVMEKLKNTDIKVITVSEKEWKTPFENIPKILSKQNPKKL